MLVGYNNNVTYKGKVYHVQTEDSGLKNPVIVTLLYYKGTILASKKTNYSHLLGSPDIKKAVRELMKEQHKAMLKELVAGKYAAEEQARVIEKKPNEGKVAVEIAAATSTHEKYQNKEGKHKDMTLDDILLDYIIKREKK